MQASPTASVGGSASNVSIDRANIASYVHSALIKAGFADKTAWEWAIFGQEVYDYFQSEPDVQRALKLYKARGDTKDVIEGADKVVKAENYLQNAKSVGVTSANTGFRNYRATGGAAVLKVFVDRFEGVAKANGIELNECSLAVAKVSLDIAAAGAEVVTVWGLVFSGFTVLSTFKDSYELGTACFISK